MPGPLTLGCATQRPRERYLPRSERRIPLGEAQGTDRPNLLSVLREQSSGSSSTNGGEARGEGQSPARVGMESNSTGELK